MTNAEFVDNKISSFTEEAGTRWLSNFWPSPIRATFFGRNEVWPSVENLYQASKLAYSTLSEDERMEAFEEMLTMTPGQAKKFGSELELDEDSWYEAKCDVMEALVIHRFVTNKEDYDKLADLDGVLIEEGNTWGDTFWGVDLETGEGENNLGEILMDLAQDLYIEREREQADPGLISPNFWTEGYKDFYLDLDEIVDV